MSAKTNQERACLCTLCAKQKRNIKEMVSLLVEENDKIVKDNREKAEH